jgi:hypothetical protein
MHGKYFTFCAEASPGGMISKENEKPAELSISKKTLIRSGYMLVKYGYPKDSLCHVLNSYAFLKF